MVVCSIAISTWERYLSAMLGVRSLSGIFAVLFVATLVWWLRPYVPEPQKIAQGATLLYYNSPAAVRIGDTVFVGYTRMNGAIEVAAIDINTRSINRTTVHEYGKPDDHASPALWPTEDGLLVATAFHSTDLFLYRLRHGKVELACKWTGMFSYPRFTTVDGETWLYVRNDPDQTGHLAVIKSPESCGQPFRTAGAAKKNYIYATPPNGEKIGWSVYLGGSTRKHVAAFINGVRLQITETPPYDETLMWSVAADYWAVTRFKDAFKCCRVGSMQAELFHNGEKIYASDPMPSPYYPTGIVIDRDAKEAIFPDRGYLERKSLPDREYLPTCQQSESLNSRAQYVLNGSGAYVWQAFSPPISERDYEAASIFLCLH